MITCEEAAKLLNEYLDKELTEQDVREFEAHVKACKRCFGCLEFNQAVRQILKKKVVRDKISPEIRNLIDKKLESDTP